MVHSTNVYQSILQSFKRLLCIPGSISLN